MLGKESSKLRIYSWLRSIRYIHTLAMAFRNEANEPKVDRQTGLMLSVVVFDFTIAVSHTQCQWKAMISWHIPLILSGNQANLPSSWLLSLPFCPPIPKPTLPGNLVTREFFSTPTRAGVGHGSEH